MKKVVILENKGKWENSTIYCTVLNTRVYKDFDEWPEAWAEYNNLQTRYENDGHWYSYSIERRKDAKRMLK